MIQGIKLVCFYGPESTGKTVMATRMAHLYNTVYVPEVAREMISSNTFTVDDIIAIGRAQTARVLEKVSSANRILICDTDLITTQIYSSQYLGEIPEILYDLERKIDYDHYFLFDVDVPWIADGLRDLVHKREDMFMIFKSSLEKRKVPFTLVKGTYEEREKILIDQFTQLVARTPVR